MKPAAFAYAKPRSLGALFDLLDEHGEGATLLAGGQSLIASLNMRLSAPAILLDINGLAELGGIRLDGEHLAIGALARHAEVARSELVAAHAPLVAKAMPHIAHPAIRNRGTFGGSIALGDPAAELPACVLALGAEIELASRKGRRRVPADEFFKDLYETDLAAGELVASIRIPAARKGARCGFAEIVRRHGDYALAGLAASRSEGEVRLAFFGVAPTPVRARAAEEVLAAGAAVHHAVAALADDLDPQDDVEASGATRLHLAGVLLKRVAAELEA